MLIQEPKKQFSDILEEFGKTLDITKEQHDKAVVSYEFVGAHLATEDSPLAKYNPEILPQGSFLINTMIKPINEDDELDIDLVCRLEGKQASWTQYDLKKIVGDRLKDHGTLKPLVVIPDSRRCWRLDYAHAFHMDVLPCIVSSGYKTILEKAMAEIEMKDFNSIAIRITDTIEHIYKTSTNPDEWQKSNPFGYGIWFEQKASLQLQKSVMISEAVQPVPKFQKNKLPLQRVVQILKRHRDIMFEGDEDKPISIIITTLAANAYQKQTDIVEALVSVIDRMHLFIEEKYSPNHGRNIKWVANPVNIEENFADKWADCKPKQDNFYDWIDKVKEDFSYLKTKTVNENYEIFKASFGTRAINEAFRNAGLVEVIEKSAAYPTAFSPALLSVPHRKQPEWQMRLSKYVEVHGKYKFRGKWKSVSPSTIIPKACEILFSATTNASKPFDVYWQVVNTGEEARGDLRGGILPAKNFGVGGLIQKETTRYKGTHWIECFIVKDGICVARSNEFFVNVE